MDETASSRQEARPYVVGLDIGGANLKLADTLGTTRDQPFPLWKSPQQLADQVHRLLSTYPTRACLAVTMTGELADCFDDAAHGVRFIADAVNEAAPHSPSIAFYGLHGGFADLQTVHSQPNLFAASNWHALASYLAASLRGSALLIDIGSTTCDVIPLLPQQVATDSRSDFDRLAAEELIYVGIGRTPICAVVDRLPFANREIPVMNEWFATTGDCAVLLGIETEDEHDTHTADGKPRTRDACLARMARMIGLDRRSFTHPHALQCSRYVLAAVQQRIAKSIAMAPPSEKWLLSGHGQVLLKELAPPGVQTRDLRDSLGPSLSRVAPAFAVAQLRAAAV